MTLKQEVLKGWPAGGWSFYQPETNWHAPNPMVNNFDQQVRNIQSMRKANIRFHLDTSYEGCARDLIAYTCARLKNHPKYCIDEAMVTGAPMAQKKTTSLFPQPRLGAGVAAAEGPVDLAVLREWLGDGAAAVSQAQAESRAAICATCPQNRRENWRELLTKKGAQAIQVLVGVKNRRKLATSLDGQLGVCKACRCHLPLKIWVEIGYITENTPPEVRGRLDPRCWVLAEEVHESSGAPVGRSAG